MCLLYYYVYIVLRVYRIIMCLSVLCVYGIYVQSQNVSIVLGVYRIMRLLY